MEFKQLFIMVHKRLIFVVCIPILTSALVLILSIFVLTPDYEASSTLYIINQKSVLEGVVTYEEILANQYLVKDYRELIKSKLITSAAISELNIKDITPTTLSGRITVQSKNDTRVLEIKVEDRSPTRAAALTNKICEVFIKKSTELMQLNNIQVIDMAEVPNYPTKPRPILNLTIALLISTVTTLGAFYLLEIINETIKTSEDVDTYLGLNVLGTIPSFTIK